VGYYAANNNYVSGRVGPETSVRNYHYTLRNSPEEGSSVVDGGSLKSS
jgi:hypothetical protein